MHAQVEAEEAARAAAKEGLGRRLREAEARAESLAETVDELRAGLDRQRAAADMRCEPCSTCPSMRALLWAVHWHSLGAPLGICMSLRPAAGMLSGDLLVEISVAFWWGVLAQATAFVTGSYGSRV